jgi:hypothetical protein
LFIFVAKQRCKHVSRIAWGGKRVLLLEWIAGLKDIQTHEADIFNTSSIYILLAAVSSVLSFFVKIIFTLHHLWRIVLWWFRCVTPVGRFLIGSSAKQVYIHPDVCSGVGHNFDSNHCFTALDSHRSPVASR